MLLNARLRLGQGYMEGMWTPLDGNLLHTLEVMMISSAPYARARWRAG